MEERTLGPDGAWHTAPKDWQVKQQQEEIEAHKQLIEACRPGGAPLHALRQPRYARPVPAPIAQAPAPPLPVAEDDWPLGL
jgi:hypothetical protein